MSYRDQTRKQITLPSGATCTIRRFTPRDFVSVGSIPTVFPDPKAKPEKPDKAENEKWAIGVERLIFTRCMAEFEADGIRYKIVDKPFGQAAEGEIEIEALPQADAEFIVSEVMAYSGWGKEASREAQNFQANGLRHDPIAPAGGTIRTTPIDDPQPVT